MKRGVDCQLDQVFPLSKAVSQVATRQRALIFQFRGPQIRGGMLEQWRSRSILRGEQCFCLPCLGADSQPMGSGVRDAKAQCRGVKIPSEEERFSQIVRVVSLKPGRRRMGGKLAQGGRWLAIA